MKPVAVEEALSGMHESPPYQLLRGRGSSRYPHPRVDELACSAVHGCTAYSASHGSESRPPQSTDRTESGTQTYLNNGFV
jgi:hypothetical protein